MAAKGQGSAGSPDLVIGGQLGDPDDDARAGTHADLDASLAFGCMDP